MQPILASQPAFSSTATSTHFTHQTKPVGPFLVTLAQYDGYQRPGENPAAPHLHSRSAHPGLGVLVQNLGKRFSPTNATQLLAKASKALRTSKTIPPAQTGLRYQAVVVVPSKKLNQPAQVFTDGYQALPTFVASKPSRLIQWVRRNAIAQRVLGVTPPQHWELNPLQANRPSSLKPNRALIFGTPATFDANASKAPNGQLTATPHRIPLSIRVEGLARNLVDRSHLSLGGATAISIHPLNLPEPGGVLAVLAYNPRPYAYSGPETVTKAFDAIFRGNTVTFDVMSP